MVVTPELITGHLDFRDRQTHFIFGDAATAIILERLEDERAGRFEIVDTRGWTQFSNNIRTNFGFLLRDGLDDTSAIPTSGNLIKQVGNKVFKEVTHAAHRFITGFLTDHGMGVEDVRRYWLHQANGRMNAMIMKLALGHEADEDRAPMVLEKLGNTAGAGAIIAMKQYHEDMEPGEFGMLCAFGAGYSIGGALLKKM
jgi:beta-ketodecanoyl-[acyl-carrier-protein] synthase